MIASLIAPDALHTYPTVAMATEASMIGGIRMIPGIVAATPRSGTFPSVPAITGRTKTCAPAVAEMASRRGMIANGARTSRPRVATLPVAAPADCGISHRSNVGASHTRPAVPRKLNCHPTSSKVDGDHPASATLPHRSAPATAPRRPVA